LSETGASKPKRTRRNMRAPDRERAILEEAVRFFAEHGFEGQTRELAKRMGITHSSIYRHFPSKEALIERVYEHIYVSRWNPDWDLLVRDRQTPLKQRILQFYLEYVERIFDYQWVRIFVFSGLKGFDITHRYLALIGNRIVVPFCLELRHDLGLPDAGRVPVSERETEFVFGLHGRIFYLAVRRFIYGTRTPKDLTQIIEDAVEGFFEGAGPMMKRIVGEGHPGADRGNARSGRKLEAQATK
jgi:AcrR family transcriptional regulator